MASRYTLVPSLGLRIGPAREAGLSAGIRRERMPPHERKRKERESSKMTMALDAQIADSPINWATLAGGLSRKFWLKIITRRTSLRPLTIFFGRLDITRRRKSFMR